MTAIFNPKLYLAGTSGNDFWPFTEAGSYNFFIDGAGGVDTLNLGILTLPQFTLTQNTDGTINLDTVAGASGSTSSQFTLYNVEKISYSSSRGQIDLRTYFPNVIDTSANVSANLDLLQSHINTIKSIRLVSPLAITTTPDIRDPSGKLLDYVKSAPTGLIAPLTVSATQVTRDAGILAKIVGNYNLSISDSSANIASNLNALQANVAKITSITQSDAGKAIAITAAQSAADHAALAKISGIYNLTVTGTAGADSLYDTINSRATLTGGKGIDTFNVTGTDTITDLGSGGADILKVATGGVANATINTAWKATLATINNGTTNLTTLGFAVNLSAVTKGTSGYKITDTGGATKLTGSALGDLIIGGIGNDTLIGGLGNDKLTGGNGNDLFVFNTKPNIKSNVDLITDFASGKDHLEFSKVAFSALHAVAGVGSGLKASEFVSSPTATQGTTANSHLIYNSTSGALYYDENGSGAGAAVKVAILGTSTHPALTAADILISA